MFGKTLLPGAIIILSHLSPYSALAQQGAAENPPLALSQVIPKNYQHVATLHLSQLKGNELNIYQANRSDSTIYMFIPYAHFNWKSFSDTVSDSCASADKESRKSVRISVDLYWKALQDEIKSDLKKRLGLQKEFSISLPPSSGFVAYLHDSVDSPFEAIKTIPSAQLLGATPLSVVSTGTPASLRDTFSASCRDLLSISERQKLTVLMFSVGAKVNTSQVSAAAQTVLETTLKSDLKNDESMIRSTTVSSGRRGGGFLLKLGPASFGRQDQSATATTTENNQRIVNRTWIDETVRNRTANASIISECDDPCDPSQISQDVIKLLIGDLKSQELEIDSSQDDAWKAKSAAVDMAIMKAGVDSELKSVLDNIQSRKDEAEGSYGGYTFKKKEDDTITLNSDLTFKMKGTQWVPTKINAYVFNVLNLERSIALKRSHAVIQASSSIALNIPTLLEKAEDDLLERRKSAMAELSARNQKHYLPLAEFKNHDVNYRFFNGPDRSLGAWYTNDRPFTIQVNVSTGWDDPADKGGDYCIIRAEVDDLTVSQEEKFWPICGAVFYVPPGASYRVHGNELVSWSEFR